MRTLFLHHPYARPRFEQDFLDRLGELDEFDLLPANLEALAEGRLAGPAGELVLRGYDAVLVFVAIDRLRAAPPLQWGRYGGLRVFVEHDAIQNYSDIFDPALKGTWPAIFRKHRFDRMITSGGEVQRRLAEDRIPADWIPKAFEPRRFRDEGGERAGLVSYGSAYRCRLIAERAIIEAGMSVDRIPMTPYLDLGSTLNRYLACMAVSSDLLVPVEERDHLAHIPARDISMRPGLEPMAKFFESAGAGCCPVADAMPDLATLGFIDGETAILFRSHHELVERLRWWLAHPDDLRAVGRAASRLAARRHTWKHRALELRACIERRLRERS